jgi:hypothetical protein
MVRIWIIEAFISLLCVFHTIRPLNPSASGRWFHDDPATLSTTIRPGQLGPSAG